jgi:hydrophobe/amphiphile efflux-1 (HAE1) family protein
MISGLFITRPVLAAVVSIAIVLAGTVALLNLPISQYPDITPPMISVSASYSGANAAVVAESLAGPIEQQINGAPNMIYMSSTCTNTGGYSLNITFDVGTDPDIAAIEIQNRVAKAEARLPVEVVRSGVSVEKQSTNLLMTLALRSDDPKYDETYLSNFTSINVQDLLRRISGVGGVRNVGARSYAMRIWLFPDRMAAQGLTVTDVVNALQEQNTESAAGTIGSEPSDEGVELVFPVRARGRLVDADEFANIIIKAYPDGSRTLLKEIAQVELGAYSYSSSSRLDGGEAAILDILLLPGANALEVGQAVLDTMDALSKGFPKGIEYTVPFDSTIFIRESIKEVYKTLVGALILVTGVIFLFLQSWRTTLIPALAVPVSLIGTFAAMSALGFSLNTLTLLGLVLSIGLVVDDAIVVVENVERLMAEKGLSALAATKEAMSKLTGALVATSLVLAAVFVPVSFMSGMVGQLYRQFSVTMVVAVLISTVVALTLSPALTALLLKAPAKKFFLFRMFNAVLDFSNKIYGWLLSRTVRVWALSLLAFG